MKTGLLGYPIKHSLSPVIHNVAYEKLGLNWQYGLYPCPDRKTFDAILKDVLADPASFIGLNVTTPWKTAAFEAALERSAVAAAIQNANVLTVLGCGAVEPAYFSCDNTDGAGLVASLECEGIKLEGSRVVVCGTGAVAMAALLALFGKQAASITVVSRDRQRAAEKVAAVGHATLLSQPHNSDSSTPLKQIDVIDYSGIAQHLANADILIDATTVGMNPTEKPIIPVELLRPTLVVVDVVYGHGETALIKAASEACARFYDGLGMLIEQAALSIEIWAASQRMQLTAPRALMHEAALNELARR